MTENQLWGPRVEDQHQSSRLKARAQTVEDRGSRTDAKHCGPMDNSWPLSSKVRVLMLKTEGRGSSSNCQRPRLRTNDKLRGLIDDSQGPMWNSEGRGMNKCWGRMPENQCQTMRVEGWTNIEGQGMKKSRGLMPKDQRKTPWDEGWTNVKGWVSSTNPQGLINGQD